MRTRDARAEAGDIGARRGASCRQRNGCRLAGLLHHRQRTCAHDRVLLLMERC
jgi:hypothetical protein